MSESNDRAAQIAKLQSEIAALQQAIASLDALPAMQQPLREQLTEKQRQLDTLQGGAPIRR